MHGRKPLVALLFLALAAVGVAQPGSGQPGTIRGTVRWEGPVPKVASLRYTGLMPGVPAELPNPNAPLIEPRTLAVGQALVYLRNVPADASIPWPHAPVRVTVGRKALEVRQGEELRRIGIVRRGDEIMCRSADEPSHLLLGRGADFFSLPLRGPERTTRRRLEKPGWVELSNGAGLYWQRGYLWVSEHPYVTLSAADGSFTLDRVPTGNYDVVCRLPDWHMQRHERNAETGEIDRLVFAPPAEQVVGRMVMGEARVDFVWKGDLGR